VGELAQKIKDNEKTGGRFTDELKAVTAEEKAKPADPEIDG